MTHIQCYDDDHNCNVCLGMWQKRNCHVDEVMRRIERKATSSSKIEMKIRLTVKNWRAPQ